MTVGQIKGLVMFQTNNDADDVGDFLPSLMGYINEGYDKLVHAFAGVHIQPNHEKYHPLAWDNDVPELPVHVHKAIADWATWLVYRNGNPQKQQRGYVFRNAFEEALMQLQYDGGESTEPSTHIRNIPW